MGSFSGLRNWVFGVLVSLLGFVGGIGLMDLRAQISRTQAEYEQMREKHDKELGELRERWNAEYQGIITYQGQASERIGRLETELRTQHSEIMSRLDRIEAKIK